MREERNFCLIIANIQRVSKLWELRNLNLEGKILILKLLALSKKKFWNICDTNTQLCSYWTSKYTEFFYGQIQLQRLSTINFVIITMMVSLKNVDVREKNTILQCSWIKRLYDESFQEWKIIPLHLISKTFVKPFIFHSNLSFKKKLIKSFPSFYKEILLNWKTFFSRTP